MAGGVTVAAWRCLAVVITMVTSPAVVQLVRAQNSPQDFVAAHNKARAKVGVGPMAWNEKVAAYARQYAEKRIQDCRLQHSGGPYGENLAWSSGRQLTAGDAVRMWVEERQWYDYNTNSCAPGKVCGHYTQVVWRKSVELGCARVECATGGVFIICNYNPPGNVVGERPY